MLIRVIKSHDYGYLLTQSFSNFKKVIKLGSQTIDDQVLDFLLKKK